MTPNVRQDLGLQTKLANGFAVGSGLFGRSGRSELDVFHTKGIEGLGDFDFGSGVEEGVGELFALCWVLRTRGVVRGGERGA